MVNTTYEELAETRAPSLPNPSLEALKNMREEMCSTTASRDFKLQPSQRFLRRVMSPESTTQSIMLVHGTGSGKTCTAIQIAEEFIVRPEFQDKKVFVLANPAIQENFKSQIFSVSKVSVDPEGLIMSKQCTGRRYLDMLQRSQAEPLRYTDKASQERIMAMAAKLIGEFYEFRGYAEFANIVERQKLVSRTDAEMTQWIHDTFDNRLIIVDEAHNLRETTESESSKLVAVALEQILKTANGIILVLLTATPMYDKFDELLYYFNLFLWNERKLDIKKSIKTSDIFTESGEFKKDQEQRFRGWCQDYISFLKGDNPFTFPFRLPPPNELIAEPDRNTDILGNPIRTQRKYLTLTKSFVSPIQAKAIKGLGVKAISDFRLICAYPGNKSFRESVNKVGEGFEYKNEPFLAPSKVALYSSKFGLIMNLLSMTKGIAFVYSNIVEGGAQLFAMCLEEHGYEPAIGSRLFAKTSGEVARGSKGKYVLFTSEISDVDIRKAMIRLKRSDNADGSDIRVVIASPKVSEGVDFQFVRQIHVLDPWFNMSRIEQVIGRGMRTCSHALLPFEEQNCTVYLHVCRYPSSDEETLDEYIYRTFVEEKAIKIAKVKRVVMESAMDCDLQINNNNLPVEWRTQLKIPQVRAQDRKELSLTLAEMSAPTFEPDVTDLVCKTTKPTQDPEHQRPLSAILDVKDEILDKVLKLFVKKPIWKKADLYSNPQMKQYSTNVISYILQNAIDSGFLLKDSNGRVGHLQAKDGLFAFAPGDNDTLQDRIIKRSEGTPSALPIVEPGTPAQMQDLTGENIDIEAKREVYEWPPYIKSRFKNDILNWYVADNLLSEDEKVAHLLNLNWSEPPIYAQPLKASNKELLLYVLGSKKIFNSAKQLITPVGAEEDLYQEWLKNSKDKFIDRKDELFASLKEKALVFNVDEKSEEIKRALRSKVIGGRACTSYTENVLNAFSQWLVGSGFPEEVKTKKDRCLFLDLLIKEAVLSKKQGIFWVTPEELEIFNEPDNRSDLLKRLKD
jgi:superfamily II DNA or RNA helicase